MKIDITQHMGLTERRVEQREHDGTMAWVTAAARVYDTEIDDVWDAITNPERIPRWFLPVSGDLRLGGRYQLEGNASGEITHCEPPKALRITWEYMGVSWVHVELTEVEGGTRLYLEHIGHIPDSFWKQYGAGAGGVGWDLSLVGLGEHLAGTAGFDPKEAETWPTTEEGRTFVAHCSEAWGQASIAAGTPPDEAKAAAERTVAFYTGAEEEDASGSG